MNSLVYPYRHSEWGKEIIYSLRSAEKYFRGLSNVVIVGDKPPELDYEREDLVHIPERDPLLPNANISRKLLRACEHDEVTHYFVGMCDDQYFLEECDFDALWPPLVSMDWTGHYLDSMAMQRVRNQWKLEVDRTMRLLRGLKKAPLLFASHSPRWFEKKGLARVIRRWQLDITPLHTHSLYYNTEYVGLQPNVDTFKEQVGGFDAAVPKFAIEEKMEGKRFFFIGKDGLNDDMKGVLAERFPNKSRWEL